MRKALKITVQLVSAIALAFLIGLLVSFNYGELMGHLFRDGLLLTIVLSPWMPKGVIGVDNLAVQDLSWSGTALKTMILRTTFPVDTIEKNVAMIHEGTKTSRKRITIPRLEVSTVIQHYNPDPTGAGMVKVDRQFLDLETKFQLILDINPQDFEPHYFEQYYIEPRINDETLPEVVTSKFIEQTMNRLNDYFEPAYWRSRIQYDPTGADVNPAAKGSPDDIEQAQNMYFWDGFIDKLLQDATTQWISYSPANFTAANIRANVMTPLITTMINNPISKGLAYKYGPLGTNFLISYGDQSTYEEALRTDQFKNIDSTEAAIDMYRKYGLKKLAGLPTGTMLLSTCRPDEYGNFHIGINSEEDAMLEFKRRSHPSDIWTLKATFKCDTVHGFGDQVIGCTSFIQ